MKKGFSVVLMLFLVLPVFSYTIPQKLAGTWEKKDKFFSFVENQNNEVPELVVNMKTYYGLYSDRACEPAEDSVSNPRQRNIANHKDAEHIPYEIIPLTINNNTVENTWIVIIKYSKHEISYIPVALIDDKMYFDFYVQVKNRCYAQFGATQGVTLSQQYVRENISCLIFYEENDTDNKDNLKIFDVRYWQTDMDYSTESAGFVNEGMSFYVPKHILTGNQIYSCTSGRSNKIRNAPSPGKLSYDDFIFSENKEIAVKKDREYASKVQ